MVVQEGDDEMIGRRNIERFILDHVMLFVLVYATIIIVVSTYALIGVWR